MDINNIGKVDIVYAWCSNCETRQKLKAIYINQYSNVDTHIDREPMTTNSCDELELSIESVLKFVNFFNNIYIVVADYEEPVLSDHISNLVIIVKHSEIFKYKEYLPTFNSQSIESNLHRIPGLLERYIYLNDDMYIGRPVSISEFFDDYKPIIHSQQTGKFELLTLRTLTIIYNNI